jgi:hypothetical protein
VSKKKTVTKWVGYVDPWYNRAPQAYIFQAEFIETAKQYQLVDGRKPSGRPDEDACRALNYRTHINKESKCVHNTWDAAYASLRDTWVHSLKNDQARVRASEAALNAVLMLERPNG